MDCQLPTQQPKSQQWRSMERVPAWSEILHVFPIMGPRERSNQ